MVSIVEKAKDFEKCLKEEHKEVCFVKTEYLSIGANGGIKISPYTHYLEDAHIGVIIYHFNYRVQEKRDNSCFVHFVDDNGWSTDHYLMNGWIISFNKPYTSSFKTDGRRLCIISNGEIEMQVQLPMHSIAERMKLLWPYYLNAQLCKTQKELDLLKDCFEKELDITNLKDKNLWEEHRCILIEEQMNAYKAVLDKISELVNKVD